jgi:hypothetical protein
MLLESQFVSRYYPWWPLGLPAHLSLLSLPSLAPASSQTVPGSHDTKNSCQAFFSPFWRETRGPMRTNEPPRANQLEDDFCLSTPDTWALSSHLKITVRGYITSRMRWKEPGAVQTLAGPASGLFLHMVIICPLLCRPPFIRNCHLHRNILEKPLPFLQYH